MDKGLVNIILDVFFLLFMNQFYFLSHYFKTFGMQKNDKIIFYGDVAEQGDMQKRSFQRMVQGE